jgi:hypothetical protein
MVRNLVANLVNKAFIFQAGNLNGYIQTNHSVARVIRRGLRAESVFIRGEVWVGHFMEIRDFYSAFRTLCCTV